MQTKYNIDSRIKRHLFIDPSGNCAFDQPRYIKVNKFDEESANNFIAGFNICLATGQPVIPILIDSYGGQVYALMSMLDMIKSSPVPVATVCMGKAMSCGAVLLTAGSEGMRYIAPHATVMIHEVSSGAHGKQREIEVDAKETERLNKILFDVMDKNVGQPKGYFYELYGQKTKFADWFITPEECLEHRIVNHIGVPVMESTVTVETKLSLPKAR
jgi:ATP-dependent Clp protease protease subunit